MPSEETIRERTESEKQALHHEWTQRTIAEHVLMIKGSEIIFFEFKEILYDLAKRLKDKIEPKTGKMTVVLEKLIEDWLLRRLLAFVKFEIPAMPARGKEAARSWPESDKEVTIRNKTVQMRQEREAARAAEAEAAKREAEARAAAEADSPLIDPAVLEEQRRIQAE
jgi:hypothetical protein